MTDEKYKELWEDVWQRVCNYKQTDDKQVNAFFSRLQPQAFSEGFLMLTADTDFIKDWVETKYLNFIQQALEEKYNLPFTVAIEVDPNSSYSPQVEQQTNSNDGIKQQDHNTQQHGQYQASEPKNISAADKTAPTSEYSFDNFVVGSSNELAYSMALSVAENPGESRHNPLFIYGKSGVGKTHLLRAIQYYINVNYPQMKTIYVDTMELVNDYTDAAIRGGGQNYSHFKDRYMSTDIVLIDDVQGLQGKDETLNIVFQIFKYLIDHGKQVVLSADRAPKHIDIEERYRSRFMQGFTSNIQPPETETKLGIIRNYIDECKVKGALDFEISSEVQEYVAQNSSSNIRELKGAITKIIFYGHNMGKETVTIEEVSQMLRDHFSGGNMKRLTVGDIQKAVEQYFSISHADLVGVKRNAYISHARQVAFYLCRTMIDIPYAAIGKEFKKDHTTVMYAVTQIEEKSRESVDLHEELEIIKQMIMEQ